MNYKEVEFRLSPVLPAREVLTAYLAGIGYESFVDTDEGLQVFISEEEFNETALTETIAEVTPFCEVSFEVKHHEKQNWNAQWESSFEPVEVGSTCRIRAPFHASKNGFEHEIIIEPKMSFGTGHHETTKTIIAAMSEIDFKNKTVLDMGTGTGVLAIYAELLGATSLVAIDIEDWAYENTLENIEVNSCSKIIARLGGKEQIKEKEVFDVVIANINRNILLEDMHAYADAMKGGAALLLSGFYALDVVVITQKAAEFDLSPFFQKEENSWTVLGFKK
ncbi:MAG: 50S ribosomal protein L11 methyltransferase [Flavobacteriales bacterium]